jgi:hypothetical protein
MPLKHPGEWQPQRLQEIRMAAVQARSVLLIVEFLHEMDSRDDA